MDDPTHLEKFNHNCSGELEVNSAKLKQTRCQQLDFFLVLDLEGKVEILEFPVLMLDAKTMEVVDIFHRFNFDCLSHVRRAVGAYQMICYSVLFFLLSMGLQML